MPELNPTDCGLERWLRIATHDLCEEAKAGVRAEITAHYEDTLADALMRGLARPEAERETVAALGSPHAARRRFRKSHLTKTERERLNELGRTAPLLWVGVAKLIFASLVFAWAYAEQDRALSGIRQGFGHEDLADACALGCFFIFRQGLRHLRAHLLFVHRSVEPERSFSRTMWLAWTGAFVITLWPSQLSNAMQCEAKGVALVSSLLRTLIVALVWGSALAWRERVLFSPLFRKVDE